MTWLYFFVGTIFQICIEDRLGLSGGFGNGNKTSWDIEKDTVDVVGI